MAKSHEAMKPPQAVMDALTDWWIVYERLQQAQRQSPTPEPAHAVRLPIDTGDPAQWRQVVAWLVTVVLTSTARREHFALVNRVFRTRPLLEASWRIADPYARKAADADTAVPRRAVEAAFVGPEKMQPEEVAFLLLDEATLTNFAHLVRDLMPDWWIDALAAAGGASPLPADDEEEIVEPKEEALEPLSALFAGKRTVVKPDAAREWTGPTVWAIWLDPDARARVALLAFSDANAAFELRLHRLSDGRAELEMSPPPRKADVTLPAIFGTRAKCTFTIAATGIGISTAESRTSRSAPCASLPNEAFAISEAALRPENGIDTLVFR